METNDVDEVEQEILETDNVEFVSRLDSQEIEHDNLSNEVASRNVQHDDVDHAFVPVPGREFSTHEEAYQFYNEYAKLQGFGARKYSTDFFKKNNQVITRIYVCNKEGFTKSKITSGSEGSSKRTTRVGCKAKMTIGLTSSGTWKIKGFEEKHNHELTSPSKVLKHRSHQQFHRTEICKDLMDDLHGGGFPPSKISKVVNIVSGTSEKVTAQQCQDHLRVVRNNNIGQEGVAIIKQFQAKRAIDPEFYFTVQVDEDGTFRSVFWADGRARESYLKFSDVLVFDVTYRTNQFSFPFAPFTGVNHHRQSILFGCALLADEKEETFVWLFEELLQCMHGMAPRAIITYQDAAICNAIRRIFPDTVHRYCSWHLDKHVAKHLRPIRSIYGDDINIDFRKWKYSNTVEECEQIWNELKIKYNVQEKSWLGNLYKIRHHWIPVYIKDTFFAGMISSQRSESMNAYFDDFVNARTRLHEFVRQYDLALLKRREEESNADFATMNSMPSPITGHRFEKQYGRYYTQNIFNIFVKEIKATIDCLHEKLYKEGAITKYIVGTAEENKSAWKVVTYDACDKVKAICSCRKFEFMGILCRHIIHIMIKKQLPSIPEDYILSRWTINVRHQVVDSCHNMTAEKNVFAPVGWWKLRGKCHEVLEHAKRSSDLFRELDTWMSNKLESIRHENRTNIISEGAATSQVDSLAASEVEKQTILEIVVRDPDGPIKTKGRPRASTRFLSSLEISQAEQNKKRRTCGNCGGKGHYRTSCPNHKINIENTTESGDFGPSAN